MVKKAIYKIYEKEPILVLKVSKEIFYKELGNVVFKDKDNVEAIEYGFKNVKDLFEKEKNIRFVKRFIIEINNKIVSMITIDRCGKLTFFVSKELNSNNKLSFVKAVKILTNWYLKNYEDVIFVETANWYKEAIKLNKLIGFKEYIKKVKTTIWFLEKEKY